MTKKEEKELFVLTRNPAWQTLKEQIDRFILTRMREYGVRSDQAEAWKISGESQGIMAVYDLLMSFEKGTKDKDEEEDD